MRLKIGHERMRTRTAQEGTLVTARKIKCVWKNEISSKSSEKKKARKKQQSILGQSNPVDSLNCNIGRDRNIEHKNLFLSWGFAFL